MANTDQNAENVENVNVENVENVNNTPQLTEAEQLAWDNGWRPKDDYKGDPAKWVPAEIYNARTPLFEKIEAQNKTIKRLEEATNQLIAHGRKMEEAGYKRALDELRAQKKEALLENDADRVIEIDDRIDAIKDAQAEAVREQARQAQRAAQTDSSEFDNWVARNRWYETDDIMRATADGLGNRLASQGKTPSEVLREVERTMKERFPEMFENPNRSKAAAVAAPRSQGQSSAAKKDSFELTDDERRVMQTFVRSGVMTKEQYIADLKKIRGEE